MAGSIRGPERRIVLVGRSGSGISATGNTILGREVFQSGRLFQSVTKACQKGEVWLKGRKVVVVDTPGFFCIRHPDKAIAAEVSKCLKFCSPGPHVILHVIHICRSFQWETNVAQQFEEVFGLKAKDYTILLFTHKDFLKGQTLRSIIHSRWENQMKYIAECGERCLTFNINATGAEREAQVAKLMTMIDDLVCKNKYAPYYTEDMMHGNKRPNFPFRQRSGSLSN